MVELLSAEPSVTSPYLLLRAGSSRVLVNPAHIAYAAMQAPQEVMISLAGRRHTAQLALADLLALLDPAHFIQVHPAWCVNLAHVSQIDSQAGLLYMDDGTHVPFAPAYHPELYRQLRIIE